MTDEVDQELARNRKRRREAEEHVEREHRKEEQQRVRETRLARQAQASASTETRRTEAHQARMSRAARGEQRTVKRQQHSDRRQARRSLTRGTRRTARRSRDFVTVRHGAGAVLGIEYLIFLWLILIRAVVHYTPGSTKLSSSGDTLTVTKGKVSPPANQTGKAGTILAKNQLGPLPVFAGGTGVFFVLSFLVAHGGKAASWANAFGALLLVTLALKSLPEINTIAQWFESTTKAAEGKDEGGYSYKQSLTQASGTVPAAPGSSSSSKKPKGTPKKPLNPGDAPGTVKPVNGKCPAGYTYNANTGLCVPPAGDQPPIILGSTPPAQTLPNIPAPVTQGANPPTNVQAV